MENSKYFYKKLITIGIPVVFQNILAVGLNLIDTLMIGKLGETQVAGVGAANQIYFVFSILVFGLVSGSSVYSAQYFGAKDYKGIKKVLGLNYILAIVLSVIGILIAYFGSPFIVGLFSNDANVVAYGVRYVRIAAFSYIFSAISYVISFNSRSIQRVVVPTIINGIAIFTNAVLNYILIFGKLGFEAMGVEGAATATLTARILESVLLFIYIYTRKEHLLKAKISELVGFDMKFFLDVCKRAIPVVFSEGSWALSVAMVYAAFGHISTAALACSQIANVISDLLQSMFFGIGSTTCVLIGEALGGKRIDDALDIAVKSIKILNVFVVIITATIYLFSKPIAGLYNFEPDTIQLLIDSLKVIALMIVVKGNAYLFICGILRGGGDTVFCMNLEIVCNLLISVPIAFFCVMVLKMNLPLTMALVELNNLMKIVFCVKRYFGRKWINILVD